MKRLRLLGVVPLLLLPLGLPRTAMEGAEEAGSARRAPIVKANVAFAVDLYNRLREKEGNFIFSPINVQACLAMTQAGARGENAAEMAKTLRLDDAGKDPHKALGELLRGFNARKDVTLVAANAIFMQKGYPFVKAFVEQIKADYDAETQEVDFDKAEPAARRAINKWAEEKTRGKIKDSLSERLPPLTRFVASSAIYYKGEWVTRFDKEATADEAFLLDTKKSVIVPMMRAEGSKFRWIGTEEFDALEMPYKGDELAMVIFLPRAVDGLAELEKKLTVENLSKALDALMPASLVVKMPRFGMRCGFNLDKPLEVLGMKRAFDRKGADFSGIVAGIVPEPIYLDVIHSAFIEVDEQGTEAGAVTHTVGIGCGVEMPKVLEIDHPFIFLIRDKKTGSILFMGRVMNPKGGPAAEAPAPRKEDRKYTVMQLRKKADTVTVLSERGRAFVVIHCPSGIGGATILRDDGDWPGTIRVQLRYSEKRPFDMLEMFEPAFSTDGKDIVSVKYHRVEDGGQTMTVEFSPGRAASAKELRLEWIDAFR